MINDHKPSKLDRRTPFPVPSGPEDISIAWLSEALGSREEAPEILEVAHGPMIRGAGTKLRIDVTYGQNKTKIPSRLWVKAGWEDHSEAFERVGSYAKEAHFYGHLAELAGVRAPRCFASHWEDNGKAVVILEDLKDRGAELWDCTITRSVEDAAAMLSTLAHLHAVWWEDATLTAMPTVDVPMRSTGPMAEWPRDNGARRLNEMLAGPRGDGLPIHIRDGARIERAFWHMVDTLDEPTGRCLLHGDPHPGNCFSDSDGKAGLYDWQTVARGPWAYDVAYMLTTCLSVEDRRQHEHALLNHYIDCLKANRVANAPSSHDAWDSYRRHIAYPLLIWPSNHVSHQSEENITALTYRLGMAADDFGFFDLWRV